MGEVCTRADWVLATGLAAETAAGAGVVATSKGEAGEGGTGTGAATGGEGWRKEGVFQMEGAEEGAEVCRLAEAGAEEEVWAGAGRADVCRQSAIGAQYQGDT